jgi:hypothetical protein
MSTFAAEWLALREGADTRARNRELAQGISAWFQLREHITVVDLGSGTGANLRAVAALLPQRQHWLLVDKDEDLFAVSKIELRKWADHAEQSGETLKLKKGHAELFVQFKVVDLARDLDSALTDSPDLVTASAFFDLVSPEFIRALARQTANIRAALYATLTYNGVQRWSPHRPSDSQMAAAFNRHQMTDKGFGPAAGPTAAGLLADQFRLEGYTVLEGDSPWVLGQNDRSLLEELQRGYALAVLETKALDAKAVETWIKVIRAAAEVGHTDIFATPV